MQVERRPAGEGARKEQPSRRVDLARHEAQRQRDQVAGQQAGEVVGGFTQPWVARAATDARARSRVSARGRFLTCAMGRSVAWNLR